MTSTGQKYPTSGTSVSVSPHSDNTWSSPTNIYADDATSATDTTHTAYITASTFDDPDQSYILRAKGFDFSAIPDNALILGVTCRINAWYASGQGSGSIDLLQLLDVSGVEAGTNQCATAEPLTTTYTTVITKGSSSDKWGNALTPAWVKDADFGVGIGVLATAANADVYVDYVTLEVEYVVPQDSPRAELYSFGSFSGVGSGDVIESVKVSVTHALDSGTLPPTIQLWDYSTAQIGMNRYGTAGASLHTDTFTFAGVAYSQLSTLRVRVIEHAPSGSGASIDAVQLTVVHTANLTAVEKTCQLLFDDQYALNKADQLLWDVLINLTEVVKTDQLLFNDRDAIDKTDQLLFDDFDAIDKTDQLLFNDLDIVDKTDQLLFDDLYLVGKTDQLLFNDLDAVDKTDQLLFDDLDAIDKADQLLWDVAGSLTTVEKTNQLLFNDLDAIDKSDQLLFDDLDAVDKSDQLLFDDLDAVDKSDQLLFNDLYIINKVDQLLFGDLVPIDKTDQLLFDDFDAINKADQLLWDVAGSTTAVEKTNQLLWDDIAAITKTDQLLFDDRDAVDKADQLLFDDLDAINKMDQLLFNDLISISKIDQLLFDDFYTINKADQLLWDVEVQPGTVVKTNSLLFDDQAVVNKFDQLLFDILVGVSKSDQILWDDFELVSKVRALLFDDQAVVNKSDQILFDTLGFTGHLVKIRINSAWVSCPRKIRIGNSWITV